MKIKVIVFDLYNTLIEIKNKNHYYLKLHKLSRNGFDMNLMDYLNLTMKKNTNELFLLLPTDFKELFEKNISILNNELESIKTYDETLKVLEELSQNFKIYLISNIATPYKKPVYDLGLNNYFTKMIFSCDYGLIKPDIDIFELIEMETKCNKKEILMIGDSEKSDINGAQKMKWNFLKINRNKVQRLGYEINSLNEIKQYIKS